MTGRYDKASPEACTLLEQFDEFDLAEMLVTAQAAIARIRALSAQARDLSTGRLNDYRIGQHDLARAVIAELGSTEPGPGATEAAETEKTMRVFAALHRSAEQDLTRVIDLYERWVKAGPPRPGTSISREWDRRLAELHAAILPPANQTKEQ